MAQRLNTFISENHFRRLKVWAASTNQKMGQAIESLIDDVLTRDVLPGGQQSALTRVLQPSPTPPAAQKPKQTEEPGLSPEKKSDYNPWLDVATGLLEINADRYYHRCV